MRRDEINWRTWQWWETIWPSGVFECLRILNRCSTVHSLIGCSLNSTTDETQLISCWLSDHVCTWWRTSVSWFPGIFEIQNLRHSLIVTYHLELMHFTNTIIEIFVFIFSCNFHRNYTLGTVAINWPIRPDITIWELEVQTRQRAIKMTMA